MTAEPHAVVRLQRCLERGGSATEIRAIVAELHRPPGLEDALAISLLLLDREPDSYQRVAAKWQARFVLERKVTLVDAQLTLAALMVLPHAGARAGVEALIELCERYGLRRVDECLTRWAERRGFGTA